MKKLIFSAFCLLFLSGAKAPSQYQEVSIGSQVWMNKNLVVTSFRNGDPLKYCWNQEEWIKAIENKRPAYTYYNFDPKEGAHYGCIYNQFAVADSRPLAPEGWRLPVLQDLNKLQQSDPQLAYTLRSKGNQKDGDGAWLHKHYAFTERQDQYGFSALPAGELVVLGSSNLVQFVGEGTLARWWTRSSPAATPNLQIVWSIKQNFGSMQLELGKTSPNYAGHYVRCIKE